MTDEEKLLKALHNYRDANLRLLPHQEQFVKEKFVEWEKQVKSGAVSDGALRGWVSNLAPYYIEKDRSYAAYLEGLLK